MKPDSLFEGDDEVPRMLRRIRSLWPYAVWAIVWVPLSFVFPVEPHQAIPPAVMPIFAPIVPLLGGFSQRDLLTTYLPALLFWLVVSAIFLVRRRRTEP